MKKCFLIMAMAGALPVYAQISVQQMQQVAGRIQLEQKAWQLKQTPVYSFYKNGFRFSMPRYADQAFRLRSVDNVRLYSVTKEDDKQFAALIKKMQESERLYNFQMNPAPVGNNLPATRRLRGN